MLQQSQKRKREMSEISATTEKKIYKNPSSFAPPPPPFVFSPLFCNKLKMLQSSQTFLQWNRGADWLAKKLDEKFGDDPFREDFGKLTSKLVGSTMFFRVAEQVVHVKGKDTGLQSLFQLAQLTSYCGGSDLAPELAPMDYFWSWLMVFGFFQEVSPEQWLKFDQKWENTFKSSKTSSRIEVFHFIALAFQADLLFPFCFQSHLDCSKDFDAFKDFLKSSKSSKTFKSSVMDRSDIWFLLTNHCSTEEQIRVVYREKSFIGLFFPEVSSEQIDDWIKKMRRIYAETRLV